MNPTDDLRDWAAAYRRAGQPSAALRARILLATGAANSAPRRRGWRDAATHVGVGAVVAIAALLVLSWIGRSFTATQHSGGDGDAAPYRHEAEPDVQPAALERAPVAVPAELEVTPTIAPAAPAAPTNVGPKRNVIAPASAAPDVDAGGDLESLRRLRAAESLVASDPARTLALLEAHTTAYPDSPLALEREALWIRAACRTGSEPTLEERRAAFARRPGVAAYRTAIDRDCAAR